MVEQLPPPIELKVLLWVDPIYQDGKEELNQAYRMFLTAGSSQFNLQFPDYSGQPTRPVNSGPHRMTLEYRNVMIRMVPMQAANLIMVALYDVELDKIIALGEPRDMGNAIAASVARVELEEKLTGGD